MSVAVAYIPFVVFIIIFLSMYLLFWGVSQCLRQIAEKRELIEKIHWEDGGGVPHVDNLSLKAKSTDKKSILLPLGLLGKFFAPEQSAGYPQMRINFLKAGLRQANVATVFWGTKFFFGICFALTFILGRVKFFKLVSPTMSLPICLFLAILGFYLPDLWLSLRIAGRKDKISKGLPDALDLLVICVEAGMGLDAAIARVAEEIKLTNRELSDELKLYILEMRAGKSREEALRNLSVRIDLEDMNSLVTLIIQTDKFGTSVTQALRVYSDSFRTKRYLRAEEIAAKLAVKLVVILILFIFPALFVVILGPPVIRLFDVF